MPPGTRGQPPQDLGPRFPQVRPESGEGQEGAGRARIFVLLLVFPPRARPARGAGEARAGGARASRRAGAGCARGPAGCGPGRSGPACRTPRSGAPAAIQLPGLGSISVRGSQRAAAAGPALGLGDTAAAAALARPLSSGQVNRGPGYPTLSERPQPGGAGAGAGGAIGRRCGRGRRGGSGVQPGRARRGRAGGSRIPGGGAAARGDQAQTRAQTRGGCPLGSRRAGGAAWSVPRPLSALVLSPCEGRQLESLGSFCSPSPGKPSPGLFSSPPPFFFITRPSGRNSQLKIPQSGSPGLPALGWGHGANSCPIVPALSPRPGCY